MLVPQTFEYDLLPNLEAVRTQLQDCESDGHVQQVAFSTHYDTLTQVCFGCGKVRSTLDIAVGNGNKN